MFMGQCVLDAPSSQCYTAQRTEEKRAHTCECCAKGGPGVCIVFNRWESRGWERVCACLCVLGACWSVFFLCLSTSELPLHLAGSRTSAKMSGHTPLFTHSLSPYPSVFIYYIYLSPYQTLVYHFSPHLFTFSVS